MKKTACIVSVWKLKSPRHVFQRFTSTSHGCKMIDFAWDIVHILNKMVELCCGAKTPQRTCMLGHQQVQGIKINKTDRQCARWKQENYCSYRIMTGANSDCLLFTRGRERASERANKIINHNSINSLNALGKSRMRKKSFFTMSAGRKIVGTTPWRQRQTQLL
jgi:hypothetical protein